ncbi:nucleotidyltransferase family protein [Acidicapsa acidisoli]|uniref:nucleotidyltransferase family protein n=1 Tax=Acidicapsa acidisoli TaxID=1615681 RepID=UPI0021E03913|nr:nucleotidyltransferase family protein [Acidicapsa acidisoli]
MLRPLNREQSIREAVLLSFCDPPPDRRLSLLHLSKQEWRRLLDWLDISGLALYFLDRMVELQMSELLPAAVIARLRSNLIENTQRTNGMIAESAAIQKELQRANLSYAMIKGFSLSPTSVTRPELRHQFDLDYLISEKCIIQAKEILEKRGYRLYAVSGKSWEFKINERPVVSLRDFYKDLPGRSVELHVEAKQSGRPLMLERTEEREFYGIKAPVLSRVDLFIGQGMHVYKDICSEFSRASHLLEFRRHVIARRDDSAFWGELRSVAQDDPRLILGLGVATYLITHVMGPFAPDEFASWTVRGLSPSIVSWIEMYGSHAVLKKFPGDKLYLLLQQELVSAGIPAKRPLRTALFPLRLPPSLVKPAKHETLSLRGRRYRLQLHQVVSRLRFHIVEGFRYALELHRWQQYRKRVVR